MEPQTKQDIYDELSALLTQYENPIDVANYEDVNWENELYEMLVKIQNRWEDTITADETEQPPHERIKKTGGTTHE